MRLAKWMLAFALLIGTAFGQTFSKASGSNETGTAQSSISTSTTLNIAAGQLLGVTCWSYGVPGTITVTDTSNTNTFVASPDGLQSGTNAYTEQFYVLNTVAKSSDTITCHYSATTTATYVGIATTYTSGLSSGTSTLDTHAKATGSGSTFTTGTFTTSGSTDLVYAGVGTSNTTSSFSAGTHFTLENSVAGQGADEVWVASGVQSNVTASMTGASVNWAMEALAFSITTVPTVSTPTFSPTGGTYNNNQSVTPSTTTTGATICWTNDGTVPAELGNVCTTNSHGGSCVTGSCSPIAVNATSTLQALGTLSSYLDSTVASATYTMQVAALSFSPAAGTYAAQSESVTISTNTSGVSIYWSTSSAPSCGGGAAYSGPVSVTASETLYAIACLTGYTSASGSAAYVLQVVNPPTNNLPGVEFFTTQYLEFSVTPSTATICYTTNGSIPTESGNVCSGSTSTYTGVSEPVISQAVATATSSCNDYAMYYKVTATNGSGESAPSNEVTYNVPSGYKDTISWTQVTRATGYKVYRSGTSSSGGTSGAEQLIATISGGSTVSYADTCAGAPSGAMPTYNDTAVAISSSETVEALGTLSGYADSTVVSANYIIGPTDTQLVTDNFNNYANQNYLADAAANFPLDAYWTNGQWILPIAPSGTAAYSLTVTYPSVVSDVIASGTLTGNGTTTVTVATGSFSSAWTSRTVAYSFYIPAYSSNPLAFASNCTATTCTLAVSIPSGTYNWYLVNGGAYLPYNGNGAVVQGPNRGGAGYPASFIGGTFSADQYADVRVQSITTGTSAGVCVRCNTSQTGSITGYQATESLTAITLYKGGSTSIATATVTPAAYDEIRLRAFGTQLQVLLNGTPVITVTDTTYTSGNPGITMNNTGQVSNFSAGGVNNSNYTSAGPYVPTYPTYTDSGTMLAGTWTKVWPWVQAAGIGECSGYCWLGVVGDVLISGSNYGIGITGTQPSGQVLYKGQFSNNQWIHYTIASEPFNANVNNWFVPLLEQPWVPGYADGGCALAGTTASCQDNVAYYPGIELGNYAVSHSSSRAALCAQKNEYCGTPFLHITKDTPARDDNAVLAIAGSFYSARLGDQIYEEYNNGILRVACEGLASNYVAWQPNTAYSLNAVIEDSNGNWQQVVTSGTSGSTTPSWTSVWGSPTPYYGSPTTDGGVTWNYMGSPCPTTTEYTYIITATDTDLLNTQGFPALFAGSGPAPLINGWSAGSGTNCSSFGTCVGGGTQPQIVVISKSQKGTYDTPTSPASFDASSSAIRSPR